MTPLPSKSYMLKQPLSQKPMDGADFFEQPILNKPAIR